jgi:hypothetical protein
MTLTREERCLNQYTTLLRLLKQPGAGSTYVRAFMETEEICRGIEQGEEWENSRIALRKRLLPSINKIMYYNEDEQSVGRAKDAVIHFHIEHKKLLVKSFAKLHWFLKMFV